MHCTLIFHLPRYYIPVLGRKYSASSTASLVLCWNRYSFSPLWISSYQQTCLVDSNHSDIWHTYPSAQALHILSVPLCAFVFMMWLFWSIPWATSIFWTFYGYFQAKLTHHTKLPDVMKRQSSMRLPSTLHWRLWGYQPSVLTPRTALNYLSIWSLFVTLT